MLFPKKIHNLYFSSQKSFVRRIRTITGQTPVNLNLYYLAFQHSSVQNSVHLNNERLELLGDAVIDLVTEMRSKIVSREQLNRVALQLGLAELINVRKGVGDLRKSSVLGNALEALTGAVYLDLGYSCAVQLFRDRILLQHYHIDELEKVVVNFKSKVIEWAQKNDRNIEYSLLEEHESKGKKVYRMGLYLDGELIASDKHFSKKKAEQSASETACRKLAIPFD